MRAHILGDRGHSFYIVLSGQMAVTKKRKLLTVRELGYVKYCRRGVCRLGIYIVYV